MLMISLQSGSNGNCTYVEAGRVKLLIDAGISGLQAERRLAKFGRRIRDVDAVILSHDHRDHSRCAGVFHRKFALPIYATVETIRSADRYTGLGKIGDVRNFVPGESICLDDVRIETIPTPHDASDGSIFVIDDGKRRLGVMTDLGWVFPELRDAVSSVDAMILESNYDPAMLDGGPYPYYLKQRIRSEGGHISNDEAAELLSTCAPSRLTWTCLGHLSEKNNTPALALASHLPVAADRYPIHLAGRHEPVGPFEV